MPSTLITPLLRSFYSHYKGGLYQVLLLAKDEQTQADIVVYQAVSTKQIWVRPLAEFQSPRFIKVYTPANYSVAMRVSKQNEAFAGLRLSHTPVYKGKNRDFRRSVRFNIESAKSFALPTIP